MIQNIFKRIFFAFTITLALTQISSADTVEVYCSFEGASKSKNPNDIKLKKFETQFDRKKKYFDLSNDSEKYLLDECKKIAPSTDYKTISLKARKSGIISKLFSKRRELKSYAPCLPRSSNPLELNSPVRNQIESTCQIISPENAYWIKESNEPVSTQKKALSTEEKAQVVQKFISDLTYLCDPDEKRFGRNIIKSIIENDEALRILKDKQSLDAVIEELPDYLRTEPRVRDLFELISIGATTVKTIHSLSSINQQQDKDLNENIKPFLTKLNAQLDKININDMTSIGSKLTSEDTGIAKSLPDGRMKDYFISIVKNYWGDSLDTHIKRKIVSALIAEKKGTGEDKLLATVVSNSGPDMVKFFQLFSSEIPDEKIKAQLSHLKNNLKRMSPTELQDTLEQATAGLANRSLVFQDIDTQNSYAASIGQVHNARLQYGRPVVIKLKKRWIERDMTAESAFLDSIVRNQELEDRDKPEDQKKAIAFASQTRELQESLRSELDFTKEYKNIKSAHQYYGKYRSKHMKLIDAHSVNDQMIVMDKGEGRTLKDLSEDQILNHYPNSLNFWKAQYETLADFFEIWLKEALRGGGFFHGDGHAGNILMNYDPYQPSKYTYTPIDFGNAEQLSKKEQQKLVDFLLASQLHSVENVLKSLSYSPKVDRKSDKWIQFRAFLEDEFSKTEKDPLVFFKVIDKARDLKIDLPPHFQSFGRGMGMLTNQLKELRTKIRSNNGDGYEKGSAEHLEGIKLHSSLKTSDSILKNVLIVPGAKMLIKTKLKEILPIGRMALPKSSKGN